MALDRRNEAVAVLGHRLDEPRARHFVAERPAQRLDALRQCFVGHRHAAPDFIEEAVLGDEHAGVAHHQRQRVEIAGAEFDRLAIAAQAAVAGVERETVELVALGCAFQENLSLCSCRSPAFPPK